MKSHLTNAAFVMLIALVIARALALETLRDPFEITPGAEPVPRTLTAAASVWMDWLACVPVLLIYLARLTDRSPLAFSRSFILLLALALWAALSPLWSSDKFAAVVGVSHFIAGVAIFFAAMQLVRDYVRLRIVAGVCFGLLLALVAYGLIYRFIELPDLQESIQKNWTQILAQRGWEPGSFTELQFRRKVMAGEMVGFNASPNTFAAMVVMLVTVSIGPLIARLRDRESRGWAVLLAIPIPLSFIVLWYTHSRTSFVTTFVALLLFAMLAIFRDTLARHRRAVFVTTMMLILVGAAALVMLGVTRGDLVHDSLTFRWRYWIGSMRVFLAQPIFGVGWNNFGDPYLAVREAIASEEIKDPHNLFVRFATELGAIGLILVVGWLIMLWWEMTRPRDESAAPRESSTPSLDPLKQLGWLAVAGMALNVVFSLDLSQEIAWVFIEGLKRLLYLAMIFIGLIVVTFRSFDRQEIDDRPAPWLRYGILVALAVFLLHNAIDFSLFETGPMWIFMLLAGASVGMSNAPGPQRHRYASLITALVTILWLGALAIVLPITIAESHAHDADELLRAKKPMPAARAYLDAYDSLPFANSDYLYRAARAQAFDAAALDEIRRTIERAIAANPRSPALQSFLARLEANQRQPDMPRVTQAFDKFLAMDPNDVQSRLLYAESLQRAHMNREAVIQYQLALEKNSQLDPNEPKRLSGERIAEINATIARLK